VIGGVITPVVATTPAVLDSTSRASMDIRHASIILSPYSLTLKSLLSLRRWKAHDEVAMRLRVSPIVDVEAIANISLLTSLLHGLISAPGGYDVPSFLHDAEARIVTLDALEAAGVVERVIELGANLRKRWVFSEVGKAMVEAGVKLEDCGKVLVPGTGPVLEKTLFELLVTLERDEWKVKVAMSAARKAKAKANPYIEGGVKVWWLDGRQKEVDVIAEYLKCLLDAPRHGQPVLHFARRATYQQILDPDWRPRPKKTPPWISLGEWDVIEEPPRKRPRGVAALRHPRARRAYADDEETDDETESSDSQPEPEDGIEPPDSSSSSSASSRCSGVSNASGVSVAAAAKAMPKGKAKGKAKGEAKAKAKAKAKAEAMAAASESEAGEAEERAPRSARHHARNLLAAEMFGINRITPRWSRDGVASGFQMSCTNPLHNLLGGRKCSKEVSYAIAGSEETAIQMLKAWVLWGAFDSDRDTHMVVTWADVVAQSTSGLLPSMAQLNTMLISDWTSFEAPLLHHAGIVAGSSSAGIGGLIVGDLLGGIVEGVPQNVHAQMVALVEAGSIPVSTVAMRLRSRGTSASEYGVPTGLAQARDYGYIGPNLPPPLGMVWKCRGGKWSLAPRGG
jgi:hypothetical protein